MALTPFLVLQAVVAQIESVGLIEAKGPIGVENQPSTRFDRSFSVEHAGQAVEAIGPADRGRQTAAGHRMSDGINVKLGHKLNPKQASEGQKQSLRDHIAVTRALLAPATSLTTDGLVRIAGQTRRTMSGKGAYVVTEMAFTVTYNMDLRPEQDRG